MEFNHLGPVNDPLNSRNPSLLREDAARFYDGKLEGQPEDEMASLRRVVTKEMFIRGAILARDSNALDSREREDPQANRNSLRSTTSDPQPESCLDEVEFEALELEKESRLRDQTKALNLVLLTCCVGAIVQGWS